MKNFLYKSITFISFIFIFSGFNFNKLYYTSYERLDTSKTSCDSSLWSHVYTPTRFVTIQNCIEVTGIVWENPKAEGDGDYHISLRLDPGQSFFLNQKNYELKDSCLIVEVVCAVKDKKHKGKVKTTLMYRVAYADLPSCCDGYNNEIYIPKKGEHIRVIGPSVIDEGEYGFVQHGWQEIHPVSKIDVIKKQEENPKWLDSVLINIENKTDKNPPLQIWSYDYKGDKVYYLVSYCCDQYDRLYDYNGNILCAPFGGLSGNGDGKCKDFKDERKNEKLIWKNPNLK